MGHHQSSHLGNMLLVNVVKDMRQNYRQKLKEQKKKEICALLSLMGPMEVGAVTHNIDNISKLTAQRYLDELSVVGHVRKIHASGKRKNIFAFEFQSDYGKKSDIVSCALSNPMHQITLLLVGKR